MKKVVVLVHSIVHGKVNGCWSWNGLGLSANNTIETNEYGKKAPSEHISSISLAICLLCFLLLIRSCEFYYIRFYITSV